MNLSFLRQNKSNQEINLFKNIISHPQNLNFFKENKYIYRSLYDLCQRIPVKYQKKLLSLPGIIFLPVSKVYACSVSPSSNENLIFLFPDLLKKLACVDNTEGLAILAHEIGHLFHEHSRRKIEPLEAQIEADDFAFKIGLGKELSDVLAKFTDIDSRTRLSFLTSKNISNQ